MRASSSRGPGAPQVPSIGLIAGAGSVASLVIAWAAYAVGVRPGGAFRPAWPGEALLEDAIGVPSPTVARLLWYAGVLGLGLAWLALVVTARRHRHRLGTVVAVTALWAAPLLLCPPVGSRDVYSYLAHGELAASGQDPGDVTPADGLEPGSPPYLNVDRTWRDVVSAYGPLATGLSEVAVRATDHDVPAAVLVERAYAVVGVGLLALALIRLATGRRDPSLVLAIAIANPVMVVHIVGGAHNEGLMIGLAVSGLAVAEAGARRGGRALTTGWILGAVLIGLGASVKVSVLLAAAYLGWCAPWLAREATPVHRRIAAAALALAIAVATIGVVGLVAGAGWGWVGGAGAGGKVLTLLSVSSSLGALLADPFADTVRELQRSVLYTSVRVVGVVASVAIATVLVWRSPRLPHAARYDGLGWALMAVALLGPAVHPWYLVWGLPLLALHDQGRVEPWLLGGTVVAALAAKPQGGGAWPNVGLQPWRLLVVAAVVAAAWLISQRVSRGPGPRTAAAPSEDPIPRAS